MNLATQPRDITAENILQRLSDLMKYPHEEIGLDPLWWFFLAFGEEVRQAGRIEEP